MPYLFNPFYGHISRSQWWLAQGVIILLFFVAGRMWSLLFKALFGLDPADISWLAGGVLLLLLIAIYMHYCTCLSRLRDSGRSRQWALISFVFFTYGGFFLMIYFCGIERKVRKVRPCNSLSASIALRKPDASPPHIDERILYGVTPLVPR